MSGFWHFYGSLLQLGWVLLVVVVTYLLFLLDRRRATRLSRTGMGAALGWMALSVLGGAFQMCVDLLQGMGISSFASSYLGSPIWNVVVALNGTFFLVAASCLLGLAIKARRSKSRVARGRET